MSRQSVRVVLLPMGTTGRLCLCGGWRWFCSTWCPAMAATSPWWPARRCWLATSSGQRCATRWRSASRCTSKGVAREPATTPDASWGCTMHGVSGSAYSLVSSLYALLVLCWLVGVVVKSVGLATGGRGFNSQPSVQPREGRSQTLPSFRSLQAV